MKYISMIVLAGLLVGCGDEQKPSNTTSAVQGEIRYTDLQGNATGSLRGPDIARVELRASDNDMDYYIHFFDKHDLPIAWAFSSYDGSRFFLDEKNKKVCANYNLITLSGCDRLMLELQPQSGLLRLQAKQSPLISKAGDVNNSYIPSGSMNGELSTKIKPNALVFQKNRFPVADLIANIDFKKNGSNQAGVLKAASFQIGGVYSGQDRNAQDRLIRFMHLENANDKISQNDFSLVPVFMDNNSYELLKADSDCLKNCQPQVKQTGNLIELTLNQATFGDKVSGNISHTFSGRIVFSITTGQLSTASSTVFTPHNFSAYVINNTAHYQFIQLFADQPRHTKQLNIAVENGQVQQMIFEDIVGEETMKTTTLATCGAKAAQSCQGIRLAADGLTFRVDQIRLEDGSVMSGSITHSGV